MAGTLVRVMNGEAVLQLSLSSFDTFATSCNPVLNTAKVMEDHLHENVKLEIDFLATEA